MDEPDALSAGDLRFGCRDEVSDNVISSVATISATRNSTKILTAAFGIAGGGSLLDSKSVMPCWACKQGVLRLAGSGGFVKLTPTSNRSKTLQRQRIFDDLNSLRALVSKGENGLSLGELDEVRQLIAVLGTRQTAVPGVNEGLRQVIAFLNKPEVLAEPQQPLPQWRLVLSEIEHLMDAVKLPDGQ